MFWEVGRSCLDGQALQLRGSERHETSFRVSAKKNSEGRRKKPPADAGTWMVSLSLKPVCRRSLQIGCTARPSRDSSS